MAKLLIEVNLDSDLAWADNFHEHAVPFLVESLARLPRQAGINLNDALENPENDPREKHGVKYILLSGMSMADKAAYERGEVEDERVIQLMIVDQKFDPAERSSIPGRVTVAAEEGMVRVRA